jgi:hypothetical protein
MAKLNKLKKFADLLPEYAERNVTDMGFQISESIRWTFPNGYGASVVSHSMNHGGAPEFAVLFNNALYYDTDVTSDVIPYATVPEVALHLARIRGF